MGALRCRWLVGSVVVGSVVVGSLCSWYCGCRGVVHVGSLSFAIVAGNCVLVAVLGMWGTHSDGNLQNVGGGEHIAYWGLDGNMAPRFAEHRYAVSLVEVCANC